MAAVHGSTQDFPDQVPGHGDLGQLKRDVAPVSDDLRADLDQPLAQRRLPSMLSLGQRGELLLLAEGVEELGCEALLGVR